METAKGNPALFALRSLARSLLLRTVRKGISHAFAAAFLFVVVAFATCRIAFDSPPDSSLFRTMGKTGVYVLYLFAGALAGSLYGAASAFLGMCGEIRERTTALLDAELFGKIPEDRAAEGMHALRLHMKNTLAGTPGMGMLRLFPPVGVLLRSLETQEPSLGGAIDPRELLRETLVGGVMDDLRRKMVRARRFAILLTAAFFSAPVFLAVLRS